MMRLSTSLPMIKPENTRWIFRPRSKKWSVAALGQQRHGDFLVCARKRSLDQRMYTAATTPMSRLRTLRITEITEEVTLVKMELMLPKRSGLIQSSRNW